MHIPSEEMLKLLPVRCCLYLEPIAVEYKCYYVSYFAIIVNDYYSLRHLLLASSFFLDTSLRDDAPLTILYKMPESSPLRG